MRNGLFSGLVGPHTGLDRKLLAPVRNKCRRRLLCILLLLLKDSVSSFKKSTAHTLLTTSSAASPKQHSKLALEFSHTNAGNYAHE
jgi:hypothetical protein